jgi:hypothetical protein
MFFLHNSFDPKEAIRCDLAIMGIFMVIERVKMNIFCYCLQFKFGTESELEFLGHNQFWNCFNFLRVLNQLVKFPEIHKNSFAVVFIIVFLDGTTRIEEFEVSLQSEIW